MEAHLVPLANVRALMLTANPSSAVPGPVRLTCAAMAGNLAGTGLGRFAYTLLIPALIAAQWLTPGDAELAAGGYGYAYVFAHLSSHLLLFAIAPGALGLSLIAQAVSDVLVKRQQGEHVITGGKP